MVTAGKLDPMLLTDFTKILREEIQESAVSRISTLRNRAVRSQNAKKSEKQHTKSYHKKRKQFRKRTENRYNFPKLTFLLRKKFGSVKSMP